MAAMDACPRRRSFTRLLVLAAMGTAINGCPPAIWIVSIDPPVATAGAEITIAGNGFGATQGSSRLLYDGEAIAVVSWSATRIVATSER